jgi:hypothetical protein
MREKQKQNPEAQFTEFLEIFILKFLVEKFPAHIKSKFHTIS